MLPTPTQSVAAAECCGVQVILLCSLAGGPRLSSVWTSRDHSYKDPNLLRKAGIFRYVRASDIPASQTSIPRLVRSSQNGPCAGRLEALGILVLHGSAFSN